VTFHGKGRRSRHGSGPNPLQANLLTTEERTAELSAILALGLLRLRARKSSKVVAAGSNSPLHFGGAESVCRTHRNGELR
jgi:hypothetical protein